jgi:HEAT repeat protein
MEPGVNRTISRTSARFAMLPVIRALALAFSVATLSSLVAADTPPEVAKLIEQLKDRDETVRLKAAKELGKLKEKAKDAIPALMAATADSDEDVRLVAGKALAIIKEASGKGAPGKGDAAKADAKVALLIKEMQSKDAKVRIAAIAKLEELGEEAKPAGVALVEFGMLSTLKGVKEAAAAALEKIDPVPYKHIATLCFDPDGDKIYLAVRELGKMGEEAKSALPAIRKLYITRTTPQRPGQRVRVPVYILNAMSQIAPDDQSVGKLVLEAVGYTGWFDIAQFGSAGDSAAASLQLIKSIKSSDKDKAAALANGAATVFHPEDRKAMIDEIGNLDIDNKSKLALYLGLLKSLKADRAIAIAKIGDLGADAKTALPVLLSLKTDKEEAVRSAASTAIEAIKSGTKE